MVQHQQVTNRLPEPVVVLGGGGFIGSNLGQELDAQGYHVTLVDVSFPSWRFHATWMRCLDLRNYDEALMAVQGAGTVFHLAADMGGVEYFHGDADFGASMDNGLITNNVVKACVEAGVERLFYASSACAADTSQQFDEGMPHRIQEVDITYGDPDARYGAEKRYGAYMVANAPLDGRVGIFHTIYGPGQEYEGRRRKFPSAVCTNAMDAADTGGVLTLFGNGQQMRSYLYIDDAVDMILTLASAPREAVGDGIFNIGSEFVWTCDEVADLVLEIIDGQDSVLVRYDDSKPSGVLARNADMSKWRRHFGPPTDRWLNEGLTEFIDWLRTVR